MDQKIVEAARHAKGVIRLEAETADHAKQAIQKVSKIIDANDKQATFEGKRIVEGHGFNLEVTCFDIFECPQGYLLHTYMRNSPDWTVTAQTLDDLLAAAPDKRVARRAHGLLVQKNMVSKHQH